MSTDELRSKKVAKNAFWAISGYLVYALAGFVSRMFFVTKLGDTITGVATLFNSMMGLISLTELGFSTAIAYHLYKPVAENDERKISALLNLYSKTYKIIGCIILAIGLSVTPIINFFVKNELHIENLRLYFFLYVVQSALSYFYSYTTILFTVTQKSYVSSNITNSFLLGTTVLQILVLQFTQSYLLYLIVWIIGTFSSNLLIYFNAGKRYPYLKKYKDEKLAPGEVKEVFRYVRATALDKISLSVKASTDNMIISKFVDIVLTGKIGNYTMIINTVRILLNFFYSSVTPSMGNFILTENKKKQYDAILTLQLITFWLFGFLSAGMMCTLPVFVSDVWLHSRTYILPFEITCLLVTDFFLVGISIPSKTVFTLKGYIRQIPYINLLNVLVNLIISLRLVSKYGVVGIYIGTILSHLLTTGLIQPYFVFGRHFEGDIAPFAKVFVKGFSVTVFTAVISFVAAGCVSTGGIVGIFFRAAVCTAVFNGIFIAVYFRDKYFKSVVGIVRSILRI